MPQRTFSALDVVDFAIITMLGDEYSTLAWVRSGTGFNDFLAQVSGSGTDPNPITFVPYGYCQNQLYVNLSGQFDFQIFPAVPITAIINNVKLRYAASIICQAQDTNIGGDFPAGASCHTMGISDLRSSYNYTNLVAPDSYVVDPTNAFASSNASCSLASSEAEHDFPGGLSYDDFVSTFQAIYFSVVATLGAASLNSTGNSTSGIIQFTAIELIVTYDEITVGNDWEIENSEAPKKKGEKITITSEEFGGLDEVEAVVITTTDDRVYTIPKIDFWYWTPWIIVFINPTNGNPDGTPDTPTVKVIGPRIGTSFSGSVPLGTIESLFEDTSGIYKIVRGKPTDTLYNPDRSGETVVTKIPDPYAATGFVDG